MTKDAYIADQIRNQPDVHRLIELEAQGGSRWRYLIETTFATYPRFVIGETDVSLDHVHILFRCGHETNARAEWARRSAAPSVENKPTHERTRRYDDEKR